MAILFLGPINNQSGRAFDADTLAWEAAVITNGGTVSLARRIIVDQFIFDEKASGAWALSEDYWGLWGENEPQALTSLKQRRLATALNTPTFVADRHYLFDGLSNYISTGFIPSTHATVMTATSVHLEVYERTDLSVNSTSVGLSSTGGRIISMRPRSTTSAFVSANSTTATFTLPSSSSLGLTQGGRNGSLATDTYGSKNGVTMTRTVDPTTLGASLPVDGLYIGCLNSAGTPSSFRGASVGFAAIGAALSTAQMLARYNAVQAWATSIGANV